MYCTVRTFELLLPAFAPGERGRMAATVAQAQPDASTALPSSPHPAVGGDAVPRGDG